MAAGVSRTYLRSFTHAQLSLLGGSTYSSRVLVSATCRRSYATAAVLASSKDRPSVTAKKATSTEPSSTTSKPKVSVKAASRTQVSTGRPGAKTATKDAPSVTDKSTSSKPRVMNEKDQMDQLDQILAFSHYMPTADVWGQKVETLDVMIHYPIFSSQYRLGGLSNRWAQFWRNRLNGLKNATSLIALAAHNAIPGITTANDRFLKKVFKWPLYIFGVKSTAPSSWLATTRQLALETYLQLNNSIAKNDLKEIKRLTTDSFLLNTLAAQKRRSSSHSYVWRFHREVNPTQIVSLRVTEGYLSPQEPKFGNRLMVHALVKFDTEQSLEIYDHRGNALHKPAVETAAKAANGAVPAEKQHVVQYLVLEKRMWYDGPWLIRDQIWEATPKKTS